MSVDLIAAFLIGCGLAIKWVLRRMESDLESLDRPQGTIDRQTP